MKVERISRESNSCNFCQRGELTSNYNGDVRVVYPYTEVTTFTNEANSGLLACICDDCLEELVAKTKFNEL